MGENTKKKIIYDSQQSTIDIATLFFSLKKLLFKKFIQIARTLIKDEN